MTDTIFPEPTDVVELDFFQQVERLLQLGEGARSELDWRSKASLERLLVEGMSTIGSKVSSLVNNQGREHHWGTAYLRQSLFRLLKRGTYRPSSAKAATTQETFTVVSGPLSAAVTLPIGSTVRTEDRTPVVFQLREAVTIQPDGSLTAVGLIENSQNATYTFESTSKANQRVRLPLAPWLDGTVSVSTAQGVWTEVRNFLRSGPTDLHFWTELDAAGRGVVHFGDNNQGAVPNGIVTMSYRYGGGKVGNVAPNTITVLDGSFTDALGNPVQIAVTNAQRLDNGDDEESTPRIKLMAPLDAQTPRVSVARGDYVTTAMGVPGVARALLLTRNQDPAVLNNTGLLFVVPKAGGAPSEQLLSDVATRFGDEVTVGDLDATMLPAGDRPKTVTFQLHVRPPLYKEFSIIARIWLRQGAIASVVRADVLADLAEFFAIEIDARTIDARLPPGLIPNPRIDFGALLLDADGQPTDRLAYSDLYNVVRDARGVLKIADATGSFLINDAQADGVLGRAEFPKLGNVVLINAKTNQEIL